MTTKVEVIYTPDPLTTVERPVFLARVPGGFPSQDDDYLEASSISTSTSSTTPPPRSFVRVIGDSIIGAWIHPGDLLIVD